MSAQSLLCQLRNFLNAVSDDAQFRVLVYIGAVVVFSPLMAIMHINGVSDSFLVAMMALVLPIFCLVIFAIYRITLARIAKTADDCVELRTRVVNVRTRIEKSVEDIARMDKQASQMRVKTLQLKRLAARKGLTAKVKQADKILIEIKDFKRRFRGYTNQMLGYGDEVNTILSQIDRIVVTQQQIRRLEKIIGNLVKQQKGYTKQLEQFSNLLAKLQQKQEGSLVR